LWGRKVGPCSKYWFCVDVVGGEVCTRALVMLLNVLSSLLQALRSSGCHFLLSCVADRVLRVVGVLSSCPGRR
jgi:hypothetical protein